MEGLIDIVEEDYENSWLYWTAPLEKEGYDVLENAGYSVSKQFEGAFANGVYYYVYEAEKSEDI